MKKYFTSESVTEGHPDKVCDQISDAILDNALEQDPTSRVACETAVNTGLALVIGEVSTNAFIDVQKVVRNTVREIGFDSSEKGFDADSCAVIVSLDEQSPDIAMGVDKALEAKEGGELEVGAGDQGMMFGYACNQTNSYMPMPIYLAHELTKKLAKVRKQGEVDFFWPDGKSQVTVEYEGEIPKRVDTVVISTQHAPNVSLKTLKEAVMETVIKPTIPAPMIDGYTKFFINPTGRFVIGGPKGDAGVTGRKIIVDTYGGYSRHGGGAFSGKDATKVDRSGAYAARHAAKNIVAAGLADMCEIEIAYAIGVAKPVAIYAETFGTGKMDDASIANLVWKHFDLRPQAIIERLDLRQPIFKQTAAYGHFGRNDLDLPWERLDMVNILKGEL